MVSIFSVIDIIIDEGNIISKLDIATYGVNEI
jgi:hypothetical protein